MKKSIVLYMVVQFFSEFVYGGDVDEFIKKISEIPKENEQSSSLLTDVTAINSEEFSRIVENPLRYYQVAKKILREPSVSSKVKSDSTIVGLCLPSAEFERYLSLTFSLYKSNEIELNVLEALVIVPFNFENVNKSRMENKKVRALYQKVLQEKISSRLSKYIGLSLNKNFQSDSEVGRLSVCK
ncbi:hypothetical protein ACJJI5_11335 [Microbulbifer sp. EKSA008]|uniref:hypothetical protein n=1 Tax=Microbulbifer sp. EKSA008 TaxID=3243367 RepID=UPI00404268A5